MVQTASTWDQVLAFGEYQHVTVNGDEVMTVFDASKCRVMLDDFATRKNDIFVDRKHEVVDETEGTGDELLAMVDEWGKLEGHALAWADALAMVVAGTVVKYVRHATAPEPPPNLTELQRPDGTSAEDGVYARRYVVTPLGADPVGGLLSFRYTSPYFVPMRDGWRLLNYTVTNDPRMEGVGLGAVQQAMQASGHARLGRQAMQRREVPVRARITMENHGMDEKKMSRLMEAAGCKAEDKPEDIAGKMSAYAAKMEDEAEEMKRQMSAAKMEAEEKEKKDKDEREAAARKAEDDKSKDGEKEAMQAMQRENKALTAKLGVLEGQLEKVAKLLPALEAQAMESKDAKAEKWAQGAIAMGRYPHDAEGSSEKTIAKLKVEYLADDKVAEKMLFAENKFARPAEVQAMSRLTSRGAGHGAPQPTEGELSAGEKYSQAMGRAHKKIVEQKLSANTDPDKIVQRDEPAVWKAHWGAR